MKNICQILKYGDSELVELILVFILLTIDLDILLLGSYTITPVIIILLIITQLWAVIMDILNIRVITNLLIGIFFVYLGFTNIKVAPHLSMFWFISGAFSFWSLNRIRKEIKQFLK